MRKRIYSSLCLMSALMAISVTAAVVMLTDSHVGSNIWQIILVVLIIFGVSVILAMWFASSIVRPLEQNEDDYVELANLKNRLMAKSSELKHSTDELAEKERNLSFIVANISEGLILIDRRGIIMTINESAMRILSVKDDDATGKHIFVINNSPQMQVAVHNALGGKSSSDMIEVGSCVADMIMTPVVVESAIRGAVIFMQDVTEKRVAEKMRREFSATVSHELKTPLTSISGYAELLKEGMAKSDDTGWISSKIYDEAQHLIELTEDIMKISRLDEGDSKIPVEDVYLMVIATDVADRLGKQADKKDVKISVAGDDGYIIGNTRLIDEMMYNLCENAIKYNKQGGSVDISIISTTDEVVLRVSDTGVGIGKEDQERVFERFYRVDKSHSKSTGGTGLGLSIVKNGALFHRARVELNSKVDEGTTITLRFIGAERSKKDDIERTI